MTTAAYHSTLCQLAARLELGQRGLDGGLDLLGEVDQLAADALGDRLGA